MSRKSITGFLITLIVIILISIPIVGAFELNVGADEPTQSIQTFNDGDYVFFIVDEGEVPLAAAPSTIDPSPFLLSLVILALAVCIFGYSAWYLTIRNSVGELSNMMSPSERRILCNANSYFHPIRSYLSVKEAEHSIVQNFLLH